MTQQTHSPQRSGAFHFRWQMILVVVLVLIVLALCIPPVRASLGARLGISVAPSNQMPAPALTLVAITPSTPTPTLRVTDTAAPSVAVSPSAAPGSTPSAYRPAEIGQLSAQAGWDILTPTSLPEGYQYQSANLDTNHSMVILTYLVTRPLPDSKDSSLTASHTITVLEALKNDFVPMQIAPDTKPIDVQVNNQPAVYAVGAWDTQFVQSTSDPKGGEMVSTWRNDLQIQNLYLQVGQVYVLVISDDTTLQQQDFINLASGLSGS